MLAKKYWSNSVGATKRGIDGITDEAKLVIDDFPSREIDNKFWDELYDSELWESTIKNSGKQEDYIKAFVALEEAGENGLDATKLQKVTDNIDEVERVGGYRAWSDLQNPKITSVPDNIRTFDDYFDFLAKIDYKNYNVEEVELLIKNCPEREVGFVFDGNGKYLAGPVKGAKNKTTIDVPDLLDAIEGDLKGCIVTHNHPLKFSASTYALDPSWIADLFSIEDLYAFYGHNMKELRSTNITGHTNILSNPTGKYDELIDDAIYDLVTDWIFRR